MTVGFPFSVAAITELVVPRSMPTAVAITAPVVASGPAREPSLADQDRAACSEAVQYQRGRPCRPAWSLPRTVAPSDRVVLDYARADRPASPWPAATGCPGLHQLSHVAAGGAGAGVAPKARRTTAKAAATMAATTPAATALASTGPTGSEIRPVSTAGVPRPTYAAVKKDETIAARCRGSASRFS